MPRMSWIALFLGVPLLLMLGVGLVFAAWDLGSAIEGALSPETARQFTRVLLLLVTGVGFLFIAKALHTAGFRNLLPAERVFAGLMGLFLYAGLVWLCFRAPFVTDFGAWSLPAPFALWSIGTLLTARLKQEEAT